MKAVSTRGADRTAAWRLLTATGSLVCLSAIMAAGCSHAQAKALTDGPPLDMPSPPPRVVEVVDPEVPPIVSIPEDPAPTPPRPRPVPPPQRTDTRPAEPAKSDPARTDPADARAEEANRPPSASLQTTPTQQEMELERRVRALLGRASTDLSHVNYQGLDSDGRTQYDTAKRFVSQAEDAIKVRNLVFAANLADKAAALAATLAGH